MADEPAGRAVRLDEITASPNRDELAHRPGAIVIPLPATVPRRPDIRWRIFAGRSGFIWGWDHLFTFVQRVGMSEDYACVEFSDLESGHFALVCGDSLTGLIVEIGNPEMHASMVVPRHAHGHPQHNIGRGRFSFMAATEELVDEDTAHEIVRTWLGSHTVPPGMDLRVGWNRTRQRIGGGGVGRPAR